jgi:octaprenyl-diphosphate synthase
VNAKNPEVTEDEYFTVIDKKTAALFEAACETAMVLCNASSVQRTALAAYGSHLGIAFQLVDDALDYEGDAESLGKNVGDDLAEGKPTLPLIYAMANSEKAQSDIIADAIRNGSVEHLTEIVELVRSTGGLAYTHEQAALHVQKAKDTLKVLPPSEYRTAMEDLANFAINRTN